MSKRNSLLSTRLCLFLRTLSMTASTHPKGGTPTISPPSSIDVCSKVTGSAQHEHGVCFCGLRLLDEARTLDKTVDGV